MSFDIVVALSMFVGRHSFAERDAGVAAIGSGGSYALSAARALMRNTEMPAAEIAQKSMEIASEICVYTNDHFVLKTLEK